MNKFGAIKVIELFAGIGCQTQALKNIDIEHEVVGIAEIDKYAISSYTQLHGKTHLLGDITKIVNLPEADLWTYSFPCQDLSIAGLNKGIKTGTRSGLLLEVERLLDSSDKPRWLLMENVKNLVGNKNKEDFDVWCEKLKALGYTNYWKILNSKDYLIPQNRDRVFMVSILGEHEPFCFPETKLLNTRLLDVLEDEVLEKFYIKKDIVEKFKHTKEFITGHPELNCLGLLDIKGNECVRRVYDERGISPTLTTMKGGNRQPKVLLVNESSKIRKLTPRECWRLMGWKDEQFDSVKSVSNSQLYSQAGNGIVIPVLEAIFIELFKAKLNGGK
ncbi:MAG: DNA cytosine methyltransferase [Cetobacterium sp.]